MRHIGGLLPSLTTAMFNLNLDPSLQTIQAATNGVYKISEFDEPAYSSYQTTYGSSGQFVITGSLQKQYSFDEPKDLLRAPVSMGPDRPLQFFWTIS